MVINTPKSDSLRAKYDLDIEQLDYKYIETCNNARQVEAILKVLRSGQEGVFPHLIQFTENRLRRLKPSSVLLRTEKPARPLRSLDADERTRLLDELNQWRDQVSAADAELLRAPTEPPPDEHSSLLPPVRGTEQITTAAPAKEKSAAERLPRIASYDYSAWDRYDVDAQLQQLEEQEPAVGRGSGLQRPEGGDPAIESQPDVRGLTDVQRAALALSEKEKGNEYFRDKDFSRAAVYYTRSIHVQPSVAAYNNRAQANLKLGRHGAALMDCDWVLRREPRNIKSLLRRGLARQAGRDWLKARHDFQQVLQLESNNTQAKQRLQEVERSIIGSEDKTRRKVLIDEVDSVEEKDEESLGVSGEPSKTMCFSDIGKGNLKVETPEKSVNNETCKEIKSTFTGIGAKENASVQIGGKSQTKARLIQEISSGNEYKTHATNAALIQVIEGDISTKDGKELNSKIASTPSEAATATANKQSPSNESDTIPPGQRKQPQRQTTNNSSTCQYPQSRGKTDPPGPSETSTLTPDVADIEPPTSWNSYEFLRRWRSLRGCGSSVGRAALLRAVPPSLLPALFGAELDAGALSAVVAAIMDVMLAEDGPTRCRRLLEAITNTERFHLAKTMLDGRDRRQLAVLARQLQQRGEDVSLLSRRFMQ